MASPLAIHAGREAAATLARHGWDPSLFSLLLGASGGPKWFILAALDRYLFGDYLQRSTQPLSVLGSSVGAWRHACLAQADPVAAIDRFAESYLGQVYSARPDAAEVSRTSRATLDHLLGSAGAEAIARHPRITTHIVTALGRAPCAGYNDLQPSFSGPFCILEQPVRGPVCRDNGSFMRNQKLCQQVHGMAHCFPV